MMHNFLSNNRDELTQRCRVKVGQRVGRSATEQQLQEGIPLFLDQLIRTLRIEQTQHPMESREVSGPASGAATLSEVGVSAALHGKNLLGLHLSVDQVVHDYGDLCQAITDLAIERDVPFHVDEFRTLNRCLDNAIADAVTEFSFQRDARTAASSDADARIKMGHFAHELRNLLGTAVLAFSAAKTSNLGLNGATGTILERSLEALSRLIANTLDQAKELSAKGTDLSNFSLADFIAEVAGAAALSATVCGCILRAAPVDGDLALAGARDELIAAVANLLQNAFKFTLPGTEVLLTAYALGDQIHIDVADHCGGLAPGVAEVMFLPFSQLGQNRSGVGLGLTIARQAVEHNGGTLTVRSVPDFGCVFTIRLPRNKMPT